MFLENCATRRHGLFRRLRRSLIIAIGGAKYTLEPESTREL
jgi:hypothetical protein